jgi:hypothetical protein
MWRYLMWRNAPTSWMVVLLLSGATPALAQDFILPGIDIQKRVNGVLSLMQYSLVPDVTTSSLSISDASSGSPGLSFTQFGGGFTISRDVPLYLEGNAAYTRYDPVFVASSGDEQRVVPLKWNTLSGTVGVGWDFEIVPDWKLRPILNFTLGHVESDSSFVGRIIEERTGRVIEFLQGGRMNAMGYGASLMLDWERYRPENEIDLEIRYSYIQLESLDSTSTGVQGKALARSLGVWSRWRAPTGKTVFDRPLRYVLEAAASNYYGDTGNALGFDRLLSLGAGIEFDSSKYDIIVTRTRFVLRYLIGNDVRGTSLGIAVSF